MMITSGTSPSAAGARRRGGYTLTLNSRGQNAASITTRKEQPMVLSLARRWWILAIRGAAAVAFGILTFVAPASSIYALVILFGAYAIVDGAFNLGLAFRGIGVGRRWGSLTVSLILQGIASI